MANRFILVILGAALINYTLRVLPVLTHNGGSKNRFLKSFLEYVPYAALGALLFPEVLYSTGDTMVSIVALIIAVLLLLLKQNMIIVVFASVLAVYLMNMFV